MASSSKSSSVGPTLKKRPDYSYSCTRAWMENVMPPEKVKSLGTLSRLRWVREGRNEEEKEARIEYIRSIVDPMDCMSDTQIFGQELPWGAPGFPPNYP